MKRYILILVAAVSLAAIWVTPFLAKGGGGGGKDTVTIIRTGPKGLPIVENFTVGETVVVIAAGGTFIAVIKRWRKGKAASVRPSGGSEVTVSGKQIRKLPKTK